MAFSLLPVMLLVTYLSTSPTLQRQMLEVHMHWSVRLKVDEKNLDNFETVGSPESVEILTAENCQTNTDCPPWMICENKTTHTCRCKKEDYFNGAVKCNLTTGRLSVLACNCVTYNNETGRIAVGACIENCVLGEMYDPVYHQLPTNVTTWNYHMCGEKFNRGGRLCGQCLPGYSLLAHSFNLTCVNCTNSNLNIWKYIAVTFIPWTCFYYFVLFFKINATSSHLHGFVIFSQAIATPAFGRAMTILIQRKKNYNIQLTVKILAALYGFWNLDFFRMLIPGICLDMSTLSILALDYAVAAYPLLLTMLSYILIELYDRNFKVLVFVWRPFQRMFTLLRKNWNIRTSVIDAYATFCLLSFCKIVCTSCDLLIPTYVYDLGSTDDPKLALFYDGTIEYFGAEHLPYAILAIIISTIFVLFPVLLMFIYPCQCFQFLLNRCCTHRHILHTFMDSFQGCYKDGTEPGTWDCRWFAGLYLLLRIILLVVYSFTLSSLAFPISLVILLLFLMVIINAQPNKTIVGHYNKINVTFISFFALFYTAVSSSDIATIKAHFFVNECLILASLVAITPLIYMSFIAIYYIASHRGWGKEFVCRVWQWLSGSNDEPDSIL